MDNKNETIIGNKHVIDFFKKTIKSKNISHSYILDGQKGIGKKIIAKEFAKTLLCEVEDAIEPCNKCTSCLMMDTGNNPDYFEITSKKVSIGVNDIREQLIENMEIKPYRSKYKIFIVPESERLTIQAQNALLKTIEEPPPYGIILLLTTNPSKLLSTVHSRCIRVRVMPLDDLTITRYIENKYNIDEWTASIYAAFSNGSIEMADKILSNEEFWALREKSIGYIIKLQDADLMDLYDMASDLEGQKENLPIIFDFWTIWFRDMLVYKSLETDSKIFFKDFKNQLLDRSSELSYNKITNNFYEVIRAKERLSNNINAMLIIENLLLQLKERNK